MLEGEMLKLLRENIKLARENNRLLKKMRRASLVSSLLKIIWWALVFGVPIYLYFTIAQPYIESVTQTLNEIKSTGEGIKSAGQQVPGSLQEILQKFGI